MLHKALQTFFICLNIIPIINVKPVNSDLFVYNVISTKLPPPKDPKNLYLTGCCVLISHNFNIKNAFCMYTFHFKCCNAVENITVTVKCQ